MIWKPGSDTNWRKIWFCIPYKTHSGSNKHGSISFMIDNMHYVILRIWEQDAPWCSEIQNKRLEVLGNTFNLHSNSTYAQEVWSLNQFICMCFKENKRVSYTHTQTISFSYKILFVSLLITDYLIRLAFRPFQLGFSMWLGVESIRNI